MKHSNIPVAQAVVYHCKVSGIKNIVISPGSRNAPLIIGFTSDSFFECYSIVDERCAAFFAMGMSQQLNTPVAVVCTSGSALLNYYPAVAEAFYSNIPLVILSADRPEHKIDIGDGQTIRQKNIYENHIEYSANLMLDVSHATGKSQRENEILFENIKSVDKKQQKIKEYNDLELHKAMAIAVGSNGPVHINIPFEEPLYTTVNDILYESSTKDEIVVPKPEFEIGEEHIHLWNTSKKRMVLVGVNPPNAVEQEFLNQLATDPSVIVFTETTSNLHHPNFFPSIDSIIAPIEKSENRESLFKQLQPDVLLTFGGFVISKKIKVFLRLHTPRHHWHVDTKKANDTFFCLTHHFKIDINSFLNVLSDNTTITDSNYNSFWTTIKEQYLSKRTEYLESAPYSDLLAFDTIVKSIPKNYNVQLANSSTVRYAQLFDLNTSLSVFCNRGTSGIDGSTSTAIGASIKVATPTLFITGDISFFYDSNALWNNYIRKDFRIILINNSGGGIFRILPSHKENHVFDNYFETKHNLNAGQLCAMHNIDYTSVDSAKKLNKAFSSFYKPTGKPKLLEIVTPRLINNKILLSYFDFLS